MPGTEISTKNCFGQFPVKNIMSCAALINGVLPSSMLSAMTPSGAMNAAPPCSFWNCIIGTSVFLLKKCTRKQCPVPVERGLLPYPLYDREQENYRTLYAGGYIAIPYAIDHPEMVADVVETLAFESHNAQNAYMDAVIRQIQGNEIPDKAMLQIIRNSMQVELACVLQDPYASWIWNAMMQSCNTEDLTVNFVEYLSQDSIQSRLEKNLHTAYTKIKGEN